jgi:SAM-dependent methyltransferase
MGKDITNATMNGARRYQQQRYRSIDQAWVNRREQRIVATLLTECHVTGGLFLDVPCGYGRFVSLFARLGMTAIEADVSRDMVQLAVENHPRYSGGRGLCADIFDLPFADNTFDGVLCIRLFHHRYNNAERQRILHELARVCRRFVLLSFYSRAPLHTLARHWRGTRGRLELLSFTRFRDLILASGLRIQRVCSLLRFCHAQTFVVVTKSLPATRSAVYPGSLQSQGGDRLPVFD